MDEVNAEHQEIRKPDISEEQYGQYVSIRSPINQELKPAKPDEDGGLSAEQAEFDINLLFDSLHKTYGLYDFYGGDAVFKAARQQAIADCKATEKWMRMCSEKLSKRTCRLLPICILSLMGKILQEIFIHASLLRFLSRKRRMVTVQQMGKR